MPARPKWGTTPRQSVASECDRVGQGAVVAGCIALLEGRPADHRLILALGGRPARWAAGYDEPPGPAYWLRVWGARGLLWAWEDGAARTVINALADDAWRVREMAVRVVIRHQLVAGLPALKRLVKHDTSARVRTVAERGLQKLTPEVRPAGGR